MFFPANFFLMRRWGIYLVLLSLGLSIVGSSGGSLTSTVHAAPRYVVTHRKKLAEGVKIKWMRAPAAPNRIKVVTFNPEAPLALDVALANGRLPGRETTSSMARRHRAVAAINGTFGLPWGRPIGLFVEDSYLKASPLVWGNGFALAHDEQSSYVGHPTTRVILSRTTDTSSSVIWAWNEPGLPSTPLVGYTPAGGRRVTPPGNACSARLVDQDLASWAENNDGIQREYVVDRVVCREAPLRRAGGTVISAPNGSRLIDRIRTLGEGEVVRLTWSIGWPGVFDAIAGNPVLVTNGRKVAYECASPFCARNPRTGIGVTANGRILLVTVDGRQRQSRGMTLVQFAKLFGYLGATEALNLDGGGSTTMVVKGSVINKPSDPGGERAVSSSILIVPEDDPGEPLVLPHVPDDPTRNLAEVADGEGYAPAAGGGRDRSVGDPGSTGGMLDALLERRASSGAVRRSSTLLRIAERFELLTGEKR